MEQIPCIDISILVAIRPNVRSFGNESESKGDKLDSLLS